MRIFGETDGIMADASSLDDISQNQAAAMHRLGSALDTAGMAMQSRAGTVLQAVGADIKNTGLMFSNEFSDQSSKMINNGVVLTNTDDDAANLFGAVDAGNMSI